MDFEFIIPCRKCIVQACCSELCDEIVKFHEICFKKCFINVDDDFSKKFEEIFPNMYVFFKEHHERGNDIYFIPTKNQHQRIGIDTHTGNVTIYGLTNRTI